MALVVQALCCWVKSLGKIDFHTQVLCNFSQSIYCKLYMGGSNNTRIQKKTCNYDLVPPIKLSQLIQSSEESSKINLQCGLKYEKSKKASDTQNVCQWWHPGWKRIDVRVSTLWCQIRTARSLLGPVVEYPRVDFCGPCFSFFAPCDFYSDHVFHFNPPAVFIQTTFFQNVTTRVLLWWEL